MMWQVTIASVCFFCLVAAVPEPEFRTGENARLKGFDFNRISPLIVPIASLPVRTEYGSRSVILATGVLIAPKIILMGSGFYQRRLDISDEFVVDWGMHDDVASVPVFLPEPGKVEHGYTFLELSKEVSDIQPISIADKKTEFLPDTECRAVSYTEDRSYVRRVIYGGYGSEKFIHTKSENCSDPKDGDDFGILVCPTEKGGSNYVLASLIKTSVYEDPEKCVITYENIGKKRENIDRILDQVSDSTVNQQFELNMRLFLTNGENSLNQSEILNAKFPRCRCEYGIPSLMQGRDEFKPFSFFTHVCKPIVCSPLKDLPNGLSSLRAVWRCVKFFAHAVRFDNSLIEDTETRGIQSRGASQSPFWCSNDFNECQISCDLTGDFNDFEEFVIQKNTSKSLTSFDSA